MALWWIGNAIALLVVIPLVLVLATRVIRLVLEIDRYTGDILEHGLGIAGNLEPTRTLEDTRTNVRRVADNATSYVTALERAV